MNRYFVCPECGSDSLVRYDDNGVWSLHCSTCGEMQHLNPALLPSAAVTNPDDLPNIDQSAPE